MYQRCLGYNQIFCTIHLYKLSQKSHEAKYVKWKRKNLKTKSVWYNTTDASWNSLHWKWYTNSFWRGRDMEKGVWPLLCIPEFDPRRSKSVQLMDRRKKAGFFFESPSYLFLYYEVYWHYCKPTSWLTHPRGWLKSQNGHTISSPRHIIFLPRNAVQLQGVCL